jgi:Tol biopolymer transport system component
MTFITTARGCTSRSLVAALLAIPVVFATASAVASASEPPSRIVFDAERGAGHSDIYSMNPDGTNVTRLTAVTSQEYNAALSPDGQHIAFESNRTGTYQIYVMDVDGTNVRRVTTSNIWEQFPRWSPDGTRLAFSRVVQYPSVSRIGVVNADGTGSVILSGATNNDWGPDWSPEGTKLGFYSYVTSGHAELYVMNADGSGRTRVTYGTKSSVTPRWSPDGTKFVYSLTNANWTPAAVHVINADGSGDVAVTDSACAHYHPAWSPAGTRIVFTSDHTGTQQVYAIDPDGANELRLTVTSDGSGDWGPDWGRLPAMTGVGVTSPPPPRLRFANPFRVPGSLMFTTPRAARTKLDVFDCAGRRVRTLLEAPLGEGPHELVWDGRDAEGRILPAAVYQCRLMSGGWTRQARLVLFR